MKKIFSKILLLTLTTSALFATNYTLKIDNQIFNISDNQNEQIKIGKKLHNIFISESNIQKYNDNFLEFNYLKEMKPISQVLNKNVSQISLNTPVGSTILIQQFNNINVDTKLIFKTMKKSLTKVNSSLKQNGENKNVIKKIKDNKTISGIEYFIFDKKTKENKNKVTFLSYKTKGKFLFIIFFQNLSENQYDSYADNMYELFLKSLKTKI